MGWNSWNYFAGKIDAKTVRAIADAMVSSGMKAAGYTYINIDDTWEGGRDAQGNIQTNDKFPDMKALADYVHSKGLKLGIYSSPGPKTCAGYAGSYGHEQQDAETYAKWGIDYLKYDYCSASKQIGWKKDPMIESYRKMADALKATGRPIVFSLCQYGGFDVWQWGASVGGNLWRTTGDINDSWARMAHLGFDLQLGLDRYAGPGHWNDPDMLEIGNGHMTPDEYRTHMSLWAILAAPLLAGNDLRHMSKQTAAILENRDVIAVDQDRLGREGYPIARYKDGQPIDLKIAVPMNRRTDDDAVGDSNDQEVWIRPLSHNQVAVGLFNRSSEPAKISVDWKQFGMSGRLHARDLWQHKNLGLIQDGYSATVPGHGVVMLRVWK
jgi:alpha-galactosidase